MGCAAYSLAMIPVDTLAESVLCTRLGWHAVCNLKRRIIECPSRHLLSSIVDAHNPVNAAEIHRDMKLLLEFSHIVQGRTHLDAMWPEPNPSAVNKFTLRRSPSSCTQGHRGPSPCTQGHRVQASGMLGVLKVRQRINGQARESIGVDGEGGGDRTCGRPISNTDAVFARSSHRCTFYSCERYLLSD